MAKKDTKQITMKDFDRIFVPINNHFADDDAIFHFETYGKELEFVLSQDKNDYVYAKFLEALKFRLQLGGKIIIDNLNPKNKDIKEVVEILNQY